jgi:hypothetical protein
LKDNIKIDFMNQVVILNVGIYQDVRGRTPENLNLRELRIYVNWFVFYLNCNWGGGHYNADLVCKYSVIYVLDRVDHFVNVENFTNAV